MEKLDVLIPKEIFNATKDLYEDCRKFVGFKGVRQWSELSREECVFVCALMHGIANATNGRT